MAGKLFVTLLGSALGTSILWAAFVFPSDVMTFFAVVAGLFMCVATISLAIFTFGEGG